MAEQLSAHSKRNKVSVFLKQHEQWSAWAFYTLMAALVLCCTNHGAAVLLMTPLIGIMQLYALKLSALYVRRSTAWAVTGLYFAATPFCTLHPAVLCMCLQVVVLYHVLVWARGKRHSFRPRHFVVLGLAAGTTLLVLPEASVFYAPVAVLMLLHSARHRLHSAAILAAVVALPLSVRLCGQWGSAAHSAGASGLSPACAMAVVVLLLLPGAITIRRSRPERRHITLGLLALAWVLATLHPPSPAYFYPLSLPAMLGIALWLHRKVTNRRMRYLLRAIGLLLPFVTLCAALLLPAYRHATAPPPLYTAP